MSIFSLWQKQKLTSLFLLLSLQLMNFTKPLRLDATDKSGGLLVYVRSYLPLRQLIKNEISSDIQALVFEINLRKEKWFF